MVNIADPLKLLYLRDLIKPAKHLSFDPSGSFIAASSADAIYVYSISTEEPSLMRKIEGVAKSIETDSLASSRAIWHPDGRAVAVPSAMRDIQVVSAGDGERQRTFSGGHVGDVTALSWSPNGAVLMTAGMDKKIILWDTQTQKILVRYDFPNVINLTWHPVDNIVSFVTSEGELFIHPDFLPAETARLLEKSLVRPPFIHDPLSETSGNARKHLTNGVKKSVEVTSRRRGTPDTLEDILGPELGEDDFVSDDDGAGYADDINGHGKRTNGHLETVDGFHKKRRASYQTWEPTTHDSFQPGSTPWRGSRKYLSLNLTGFVWTVDQDSHYTVTVEFYDRELHRDFHFTDPYGYDKACLNENGTLFSCPPADGNPAMVFYRPHETWTTRADWRTKLPEGEDVVSIALSESYIVVTTSADYVRIYTLYGTPFQVYRQKSSPTVTCTAWRDYILTMGNGPVGGDGSTKLLYTIENVKRDDICQSEDTVAIPEGETIKNVFFSDTGDPCIYDSTGTLLILQHWRSLGQARWVPILDTKKLDRLATGKKEETYWPVALAQGKFHCIILKGGDQYPYFPKPLLSEFDLKIPLSSISSSESVDDATTTEGPRLEEAFVRSSLFLSLAEDLIAVTNATHSQRADISRREIEVDKVLLQMLNIECREGEERGMKALEIVQLMRDRGGKMIEAAAKVAGRYGRNVLQEKIVEVAERKLLGEDDAELVE